MSKRIAALDLGTNTFHLLIADVSRNSFKTVKEIQNHAKLGEGGITEGYITETAFNRGLAAIDNFHSIISENKVDVIKASGTAALRSAKNGIDFINAVKKNTGIRIDIIEGDLEAELIYNGVKAAVDLSSTSLLMDIGGGSVEFILCNKDNIFWKKSYPIGAARLMALFHKTDPISAFDIEQIYKHLDSHLSELKENIHKYTPIQLIGSAGAFETFAALTVNKFKLNESTLQTKEFRFNSIELQLVIEDILKSNHEHRKNNSLIIPVRTDMIVVASVLTKYIIDAFDIPIIKLSRYALKEGLLFTTAKVD